MLVVTCSHCVGVFQQVPATFPAQSAGATHLWLIIGLSRLFNQSGLRENEVTETDVDKYLKNTSFSSSSFYRLFEKLSLQQGTRLHQRAGLNN